MKINKLELSGFRNLEPLTLTPSPGINVIHGKNAQGKTNLLESVWMCCGMKSFRGGGHFGDCRNCHHFYPEKPGLRIVMREDFRKKVDEDGVFLMEMIEQVRRGNGAQEDIMSALLRLQNSSSAYRKVLERDPGGRKNG